MFSLHCVFGSQTKIEAEWKHFWMNIPSTWKTCLPTLINWAQRRISLKWQKTFQPIFPGNHYSHMFKRFTYRLFSIHKHISFKGIISFSRLYPVSSSQSNDIQYLSISHSGVRLVRREKSLPTDYLRVSKHAIDNHFLMFQDKIFDATIEWSVCNFIVSIAKNYYLSSNISLSDLKVHFLHSLLDDVALKCSPSIWKHLKTITYTFLPI